MITRCLTCPITGKTISDYIETFAKEHQLKAQFGFEFGHERK